MQEKYKIALLGGGGRTGQYILTQLLKDGYQVKVLLRKPEIFPIHNTAVGIIKGDALDLNCINLLLDGCNAVINTISQRKDEPLVASLATLNVLKAMNTYGIKRYITVAGLNIDTPYDKKGPQTRAATDWMKTTFPAIHEDRQKAYSILAESAVNWTLVRVPLIDFTESDREPVISLEECYGSKAYVADIAKFVVGQLSDNAFVKKSPFIANP